MNIYVCSVCNHLEFTAVEASCPVCGAPKTAFKQNNNIFTESEKNSPEASVKHIPSITIVKECGLIKEDSCVDAHVRIGETLHPMEAKHYIHFIDCYVNDTFVGRTLLTPNGVNPATAFHLKATSGKVTIVENCNVHGHWKKDTEI